MAKRSVTRAIKKNSHHQPRSHPKQKFYPKQNIPFGPYLGLDRPVVITDEQADEYAENAKNALKQAVGARALSKFEIIDPKELKLPQVYGHVLSSQVLNILRNDQRRSKIEKSAAVLRGKLDRLLEDTPPMLTVGLGQITPLKQPFMNSRRQMQTDDMIAINLSEWRGPKRKYGTVGADGLRNPLHQLTVEQMAARDTLLNASPWLEPHDILPSPSIPILRSLRPLKESTFSKIQESFSRNDVIPLTVTIGDPMLYAHLGQNEKPEQFELRTSFDYEELMTSQPSRHPYDLSLPPRSV